LTLPIHPKMGIEEAHQVVDSLLQVSGEEL